MPDPLLTPNLAAVAETAGEAAVTFSFDQVLSPYIWVLYAAFLVALITTPIMRALALKNGIVDWPDLKRKAHVEPVAYLGGVAVFLGWLSGVVVCFFIEPHYLTRITDLMRGDTLPLDLLDAPTSIRFPISILLGAMTITLVGLFDDVYGISPRVKLGGQIFAAAALASQTIGTDLAAGLITLIGNAVGFDPYVIPGFGSEIHYQDPSYWVGAIMVAFLVLGGCNAANLMDGLDGLASGVTGIVAIGFAVMAICLGMGVFDGTMYSAEYDPVRIVMCLALLGAVLGFLPFNFNPATIFMGDAGSMLLGYLCMSTVLLFGEKGEPALAMAALMVFGLPMVDTALAIVRRKVRGQPIFSPDNQHLHHQLIRAGLSVKQAVLTLYLMAIGFAILGVAMIFVRLRYVALLFIIVCAFVAVTAFKVGHRQLLAMQAAEAAKAKGEPPTDDKPQVDPAAPGAPLANDTASPPPASDSPSSAS